MYNSELMKALDEVYERMPYKWEKWEKSGEDREPDVVDSLQDASLGYFPMV